MIQKVNYKEIIGDVKNKVQCVTRTCIPNRITPAGGIGQPNVINVRFPLVIPTGNNYTDITFRWSNTSGDTNLTPANNVTIRAALENPAGRTTPITWKNGSRDCTIEPNLFAETEPIPAVFEGGTTWYLRYRITVPTDGFYEETDLFFANLGGRTTAGGDLTLSGTIGNSGQIRIPLPPIACFGRPLLLPANPVNIVIIGDSISVGANDNNGGSSGTYDNGFICRALANKYPYTHLGVQGLSWGALTDSISPVALNRLMRRFQATRDIGFTHALINLGTNDIASDATTITIPAASLLLQRIISFGIKPIIMTLTPRTNAGNTAPDANNANILTYNTWVRTDPLGFGYFDANIVARDSSNNNLWRTDLGTPTTDGVHPNFVIHNALATALAAQFSTLLV